MASWSGSPAARVDDLARAGAAVRQVDRLGPLANPHATTEAIVRLLHSRDPSQLGILLRFGALGGTAVLGASAERTDIGLRVGDLLPASRDEFLRATASRGPWLARWTGGPEDGDFGARMADWGIETAAFVPIVHDGQAIGLIVLADPHVPEVGLAALAERLPVLIEVGELAGFLLAPAFERLDALAAAGRQLDGILASNAFRPVFQPIWHLATNSVVGFEALTRFSGRTPDEVFDQASLLGRLEELEVATLTAALAAAERLPPNRWLSVNVSAALLADTTTLRRLLGGSLRPIVLELSEHEIVHDYEALTTSLKRMAPWVSLAIDDAGAGFSSLRHILETSPGWVKLDLGLVRGVDTDPARQALVAGLVHFAGLAAIALIAEGIETEAELQMLKSLGVKLGQGYFLARPVPSDDVLIADLLLADRLGGRDARA